MIFRDFVNEEKQQRANLRLSFFTPADMLPTKSEISLHPLPSSLDK